MIGPALIPCKNAIVYVTARAAKIAMVSAPAIIKLENDNIDLNLESFHINQNLPIKLAATIMLEAFDAGADLLIVDKQEIFKLFDSNRASLSKAVGREVIIPVLHKSELFNLALNKHDIIKNQLKKHEIDPEII